MRILIYLHNYAVSMNVNEVQLVRITAIICCYNALGVLLAYFDECLLLISDEF